MNERVCIRATAVGHPAGAPSGLLLIGARKARELWLSDRDCFLCSHCYAKLIMKQQITDLSETLERNPVLARSASNETAVDRYGLVA